jgi:cytochrome c biogenesis protein
MSRLLSKRLLRRLSSLPLAIAEMGLIAALSAVGTIIEQNKPIQFYIDNYPDDQSKVQTSMYCQG